LTYPSIEKLLAEIRDTGQSSALAERSRGLLGTRRWRARLSAYETFRRDGRIPATVEIVYGHAWKGAPKKAGDGSAIVQFHPSGRASMRGGK
jgi:malonyl-CoA O-methyltransferase